MMSFWSGTLCNSEGSRNLSLKKLKKKNSRNHVHLCTKQQRTRRKWAGLGPGFLSSSAMCPISIEMGIRQILLKTQPPISRNMLLFFLCYFLFLFLFSFLLKYVEKRFVCFERTMWLIREKSVLCILMVQKASASSLTFLM